MGLRGRVSKPRSEDEARAIGHRAPETYRPAADVKADAEAIYRRLMRYAEHFAAIVDEDIAEGDRRPSPALWAFIKCGKEALQVAYRTGGLAADDSSEENPFEAYQKAKRAARSAA